MNPVGHIRALFVAVVALTVLSTSCSSGDTQSAELRGARVEVLAVWSGTEQQRFAAVIRVFESETGVVVRYVPAGHDIPSVLAARRAAHRLPDVAFIPQPGLLREYVHDGVVLPLTPSAVGEVTRNYPSVWRQLGAVDGRLYAVWFKAANKSLVWYDLSAFEKAGVIPPGDLNGLVTLSRTFATRGVSAFSLGARDGWTLTDWFENVYLALAGPRRYDDLATHRIPWTDPTVKQALRLLAELWTPRNVAGGVRGALATTFERSVQRAFGPQHAAAMAVEGDFVESAITGLTGGRLGVDVDVFPFPGQTAGNRFVVGGGDAAVVMRRTPAADAFLEYLATPQAAAVWAAYGGFVSPNLNVDLSVYPDPISRTIARSLVEAGDGFRFDLSDLQPVEFGGTEGRGMRGRLQRFLVTGDVDATAAALEADALAAYR